MTTFRFVATRVYEKSVGKIMTPIERYRAEAEIRAAPELWPIVPGTGGVRKARAARGGRGKSGGARIIYYFHAAPGMIYLLTAYAKSESENLTEDEKKQWAKYVQAIKRGETT